MTTLTLFLMGLAANALRRVWKRGGAQPRVALIVLREVLLIFSLIAIYAYMSGQAIIAQDGSAEGFVQYLTEYSAIVLLCMPLLCVIASYIIQDVRYLHQRRLNRLYEYQQEAYEAALGSQQRFRHNIVNMLYGLEGAINSEDTEEIRRYYEQLLEKCALANNDNVLALRRVTQPALNGLLLRVLDKARGMSLPLQLDVEEGLGPCRHINAVDLCQIVGVLADNALEAAERAEVRYVGISLSALEDGGDGAAGAQHLCRGSNNGTAEAGKRLTRRQGMGMACLAATPSCAAIATYSSISASPGNMWRRSCCSDGASLLQHR